MEDVPSGVNLLRDVSFGSENLHIPRLSNSRGCEAQSSDMVSHTNFVYKMKVY